ncbi:MAG: hypothetical protein MOGMAGMI_00562 [Candidatus Omnitrophica bacterium]|nr:hypothetical protein [Candidatus Omnitrophota bacterium]
MKLSRISLITVIALAGWTAAGHCAAKQASSTAAAAPAAAPAGPIRSATGDLEYYDCTVLLIDHKQGVMGVQFTDEGTNQTSKVQFQVDRKNLFVTDILNRDLLFRHVKVGQNIDVYAREDGKGKLWASEIMIYEV